MGFLVVFRPPFTSGPPEINRTSPNDLKGFWDRRIVAVSSGIAAISARSKDEHALRNRRTRSSNTSGWSLSLPIPESRSSDSGVAALDTGMGEDCLDDVAVSGDDTRFRP